MDCISVYYRLGMNAVTFLWSLLETFVSGILLALFFFLVKEKWNPPSRISGMWHFETTTQETDYLPYQGILLRFVAVLWVEGGRVNGTTEKVYEHASTGPRSYVGKDRTRGVVEGYLERNYLGQDRLFLHVVENGQIRNSTTLYELSVESKDAMTGHFSSMVSAQKGDTRWQRHPY